MAIPFHAYVAVISEHLQFWRSYFLSGSTFYRTGTISEQLLLSELLLFQSSYFCRIFAAVIFADYVLFQRGTSTEKLLLENKVRSSLV